ncbi:hypothetical protein [Sphingomonas sp. Leaf28]|uniref:hypothetical protein n=1 Tax=Sphingomonas sp. Leaf28 TaxID=1735695 RepID=UPI0006F72183|nr:hypothetical protein [Sphingomonas sp. Leaf28]KQN15604.1 hypothetical protein ASE79_02335 [Sphingomonas sp. Leaf28]
MSDAPQQRLALKDIIMVCCAVVAPLAVVGGMFRADGNRSAQIDTNTRRIEVLEAANQAKTDLLTKIDGRTIRIETKLEMMAPAPKMAAR